jgi:outer membrane receptor for ferrienterochelin and colicins
VNRRNVKGLISWTAGAAILAVSLAARAEDTSELEGLLDESIVTTASKSAETATTAPATSSTLTAEDMRAYGIHSLAEAINYLGLGAITFDPLFTADIGARGVFLKGDQGNHFLLLVDGHAVNEQLRGSARFDRGLGIPIEMVDHVEVILGPGSVLYGSNAMLGVINVVTKRAKHWQGLHLGGEVEFGKSGRVSGGVGTTFNLFTLPAELTVGIEYYNQSGPAFTFAEQRFGTPDPFTGVPYRTRREGPPTGIWGGTARRSFYSEVPAGQLRLVTGPFELSVHTSTFKRAAPYSSYYVNRDSDFDDPNSYTIDRSLWVDLKHGAALSQVAQLNSRVYVDSFDTRTFANVSRVSGCRYQGTLTCSKRDTGVARWAGAEVQGSFDWLKTGQLVTLLGADGRIRDLVFQQDVADFDTGAYLRSSQGVIRARDAILGAFLQQTYRPFQELFLNGGVRFDFDRRFSPVFSPRLAATASVWRGGTLKAVFAEAFRAPSWMETSLASGEIVKADSLVPERVRSFELSVEQRFGKQRISMGAFRSWWRNLVELHALSLAELLEAERQGKIDLFRNAVWSQYQNVATIENYGFNGAYEGALAGDSLRYGINVTGAIARREDGRGVPRPVEVAPRFFGNARILYDFPGDWPALGLAAQFKSSALTDRSLDGGWATMPIAPGQVQVRATLSGPIPAWKAMSYRVSADYAFVDRAPYVVGLHQLYYPNYREYDEWHLAPVDTFRVTAGLSFDFMQ